MTNAVAIRSLTALALVAAAAGCRTPVSSLPPASVAVGAIAGRIEGAAWMPGARVEVYRDGPGGSKAPIPFEQATPDKVGRFETSVLPPGRYLVVYRTGEAPPSISEAHVPAGERVTLRPVVAAGLTQLRVTLPAGAREPVTCRLTEAEPSVRVPDRRDFTVPAGSVWIVRGLRPGRYRLDVPGEGASTEIELPTSSPQMEMALAPPTRTVGAEVVGHVTLLDGDPAAGLAVTARPLKPSGRAGQAWARYGSTDLNGRYQILGIPPGPCLIRVECREVVLRILPSPLLASIPPSGRVELGFVVEP